MGNCLSEPAPNKKYQQNASSTGNKSNRVSPSDVAITSKRTPSIVLRILSVNDVYELNNWACFSSCKKQVSEGPTLTIGVLPGDFLGPSLLSSLDKGAGMVHCMSAAGIDFVCIGNHENDIPFTHFPKRVDQSTFVWLNSNMQTMPLTSEKKAPEYFILDLGEGEHKRRVALLGFNTTNPTILRAGAFGGATIEPIPLKLAELTKKLIEEEKVDLVIPLTHQTVEEDKLCAEMELGIRVIFGGHEHEPFLEQHDFGGSGWKSFLEERSCVQEVPGCTIIKTGMDGKMIAICDIVWDAPGVSSPRVSTVLKDASNYPEDPVVVDIINVHKKVLEEVHKSKLCRIPEGVTLSSIQPRLHVSTFGIFYCTILKRACNAEIALVASGGIRGKHDYNGATHFTYADLKNEISLPTDIIVVNLPGSLISEAISFTRQFSLLNPPEERPGFLQADDGVVWVKETNTVTHINGEPIDLTRKYSTAVPSLQMLKGMDSIEPFIKFKQEHPECLPDNDDTGIEAKAIIIDYFSKKVWADILTQHSFEKIDTDGDGYIEFDELMNVARATFGEATRMMVNNLFAVADESGDGKVSREEILDLSHTALENIKMEQANLII